MLVYNIEAGMLEHSEHFDHSNCRMKIQHHASAYPDQRLDSRAAPLPSTRNYFVGVTVSRPGSMPIPVLFLAADDI